ncbi:peptidoglycan-binding protein [Cohaesibacter haloalkalitolerans]|uniref:peptidoglycan-binding protein n=1 Tax=Cohaesibacter haloalkalitolerans TaxID=1162980 RepID=UPI000E65AA99|nr:peptidoglycan-binding protein [Cohaesibacter haloalkalitolerans]
MIDETYHTDRDVGEFIEGFRGSDPVRKPRGRARGALSQNQSRQNAALLSAIEDIEAQLHSLAGQSGLVTDDTRSNARNERPARKRAPMERSGYGSALERIEAQLQRVDHALERQQPRAAREPYAAAAAPAERDYVRSAAVATGTTGASRDYSLDSTVRQMLDRTQSLNEEIGRTAKASVSEVARTAQDAMSVASKSQDTYRDALAKLAKLQSQDDSLDILRDDVSSLRTLIEEANLSGASEAVLREIANLSGRIEQLSSAIAETREDPALLDTMHEIRALLDRPTLDPSIDSHFDRILRKLDDMHSSGHDKDFARLSEQMDHLRDILSTQPDVQHLSNISGQINELINRLAILEDDVRRGGNASSGASQSGIEERLAQMQTMIERLDPSDRLMSLENQLASLADRLEDNSDVSGIHKPLEALARQVESLVKLTDQRSQPDRLDILENLAERVANLDQFIRHEQAPNTSEKRFDQVEQTLARIDDMLASKMESADLTSLERSLSRLADRMEAQEDLLRAAPVGGNGNGVSPHALSQLESQIVDLAQRLDSASNMSDDRQFFEMLTERLDTLAAEFARAQSRFEAVDRMGEDIRQLASKGAPAGVNTSKLAEQAAIKALQQVGPLGSGSHDAELQVIIDGLKDDLHGLRRFAETSETSTQQSLNSVSSMLNIIVDRLGQLEEQVRAGESAAAAAGAPSATVGAVAADESEPQSRGFGKLLRRRKAKEAPVAQDAVQNTVSGGRPLTADELLQSRGRMVPRGQASEPLAAQQAPQAPQAGRPVLTASAPAASAPRVSAQGEARQPGIYLSGKAVSGTRAQTTQAAQGQAAQAPTAKAPGGNPSAQQQFAGNAVLKQEAEAAPAAKPRTARIVPGRPGATQTQAQPTQTRDPSQSKADFIAAARRAAQAAAQESEKVEKEQSEAGSFLSRFKGSKKAKPEAAINAPQKADGKEATVGMSRKERRAAISEAARMAKQMKKEQELARADQTAIEDGAAQLLEDDEVSNSLFAKLGHSFSRHSRPLLMAAAAILLAITTIQLVKNPDSSLYSLFNAASSQSNGDAVAPSASDVPTADPAPETGQPAAPGPQSSLTPSSGNLAPHMGSEEATRAIAFAQPTLAQGSLGAPRVADTARPQISQQDAMARAKAALNQSGDHGIDLTPTSSIPKDVALESDDSGDLQAAQTSQPMPPVLSDDKAEQQASLSTDEAAAIQTPIMQAANSGNTLAQFELGRRYTVGDGVEVNLPEAAKWFEKAANLNMAQAQYSLANLYEKGQGVKKDLQVARLWYQRAADQGNVKSMHNLAVLYAEGGLGQPDFNEAAQWFLKAADHGLKDSQYNLAILFARGMGVKQDLLQSYKWFALAAYQGDKGAEAKRDEILSVLKGPQQKAAKALVAAWSPKAVKPSVNEFSVLPPEWAATTPDQMSSASGGFAVTQGVIAKTQAMLGALGYNAGPADGQMGPRTRMAIRNFQEIAGLKVTGQIDTALLDALAKRTI